MQLQEEKVRSWYGPSLRSHRITFLAIGHFRASPVYQGRALKRGNGGAQNPRHRNYSKRGINGLTRAADGVFYAELNEFFQRELAEEGYSGVEVRVTPTVTDIIIRATHTQEVLGEQGRRIRELTSLIQKRFKFPENSVSLYAAKVQNRGLSAVAQCESLRYKLLNGLAVRRACYGVLRFIMESGAKGCEVVVSGKLRAARAKSMKFTVCCTL